VNKLFIHPATTRMLTHMTRNMPGSLLISGEVGVGLGTIAAHIAHELNATTLTVLPEKKDKIDLDKGTVSIESIRRLYDQTRSIQSGKLVVIIDYAERMSARAQNAFLKLLEEPRKGIHFILASHTPDSLLPTVHSRVQHIDVLPITHAQTLECIKQLGVVDGRKQTQLLYIAEGLPAEMIRLFHNATYFEERALIIKDARLLLTGTLYDKLLVSYTYSDSRENTLLLLTAAMSIVRRTISDTPHSNMLGYIDKLLLAYTKVQSNGSIKLTLARLVV